MEKDHLELQVVLEHLVLQDLQVVLDLLVLLEHRDLLDKMVILVAHLFNMFLKIQHFREQEAILALVELK